MLPDSPLAPRSGDPDAEHTNEPSLRHRRRCGSEVVGLIAAFWGCSHLQAHAGLAITTQAISDLTASAGRLTISGIGSWEARGGATRRVRFKPSGLLTRVLNEPLCKHSRELANVSPAGVHHLFHHVSSVRVPEDEIMSRVVMRGRANATDLHALMACRGMITPTIAQNFMLSLKAVLRECLVEHHSVLIRGFGQFKIKDSPARTIRHPRTGEPLTVPAHRQLRFSIGQDFRRQLNHRSSD